MKPLLKLPITIGTVPLYSTYRCVHFEDSNECNHIGEWISTQVFCTLNHTHSSSIIIYRTVQIRSADRRLLGFGQFNQRERPVCAGLSNIRSSTTEAASILRTKFGIFWWAIRVGLIELRDYEWISNEDFQADTLCQLSWSHTHSDHGVRAHSGITEHIGKCYLAKTQRIQFCPKWGVTISELVCIEQLAPKCREIIH